LHGAEERHAKKKAESFFDFALGFSYFRFFIVIHLLNNIGKPAAFRSAAENTPIFKIRKPAATKTPFRNSAIPAFCQIRYLRLSYLF
jgi:hypothetical protein